MAGDRPIVGITHGDFNGIGYEIIIKTFTDPRVYEGFTPVIYGSSKIASYHRKTLNNNDVSFNLIKRTDAANPKRINIINVNDQELKVELGKLSAVAGEMAYEALEAATEDLRKGEIDVIVTAPINKQSIQSKVFHFPGHTEYLAEKFNCSDYLMLMVSNTLRIGVITGHIALKEVFNVLTTDLILRKLRILNHSLKQDFAISSPRIALLGLNPHAGDNNLMGDEENRIIKPAIEQAFNEGILAFGPFPADGFFGSSTFKNFDAVLAMYHDQGMLPFKAFAFDDGVNYTAGLPIIRTSPAHGTAYEIAGKDMASPDSFRAALFLACDIYNNRRSYREDTANPLPYMHHETER